jgi:predicted Ser/Thr protein kinase
MNPQDKRILASVGITCFIRDFEIFKSSSDTDNLKKAISYLMDKYNYTEKAAKTRVSKARRIIKNKQLFVECLHYIINDAKLIPDDVRADAKHIQECSPVID